MGLLSLLGAFLASSFLAAPAADAQGPVWAISSASSPTNFAAGDETGDDRYVLTVVDVGTGPAQGNPIEVTDTLPSGITASGISGEDLGNGQPLSCHLTPTLSCNYEGFEVAPGDVLQIEIAVKVSSGVATSVDNSAMVTGGGAEASGTVEGTTTISSAEAGFGVSGFATTWSGPQAGTSVNITAGFTFNQVVSGGETIPAVAAKEVILNLPPGFLANPRALPKCAVSEIVGGTCSAGAAVGVAFMSTRSEHGGEPASYSSLVYNAEPLFGEPWAVVLILPSGPLRLPLTLRSNGDFGLRIAAAALPEVNALISMTMTLWGVPGAYDGAGPDHVVAGGAPSFGGAVGASARFLTSAGKCGAPLPDSTLVADSWALPGVFVEASSPTSALTGCNGLSFDPSLALTPDISEANEPSGYELDLTIPQTEEPEKPASAELREATVTLPEGATVSLSSADGLKACTQAQAGLDSTSASTCPEASKVGEVSLQTPLLASPLHGHVFFAAPIENPLGASLAVYLLAEGPGLQIKLAAQLRSNPVNGQLTIVFRELPQIPISGLDVRFYGGARALLSTPSECGVVTGTSELTPWSGNAAALVSSSFEVDSRANGVPCAVPPPFGPIFQAGSTTTGEADVYDSLTMLLSRADQEEQFGGITIQAPSAVAQMFSGVPPCGEPQASSGTCPTSSEVGTVAAQAGLGPDPADLNGYVYLTGAHGGSTQGLSIVLPVAPGPFELGAVVVRASTQIDSVTGRLNIASDRLPSVVSGVPLNLKALVLQFTHGEFRIAPDGCEPLTVTGTITSLQGSSVSASADPLGASSSSCPPPESPSPAPIGGNGVSHGSASELLIGKRITTIGGGRVAVELTCSAKSECRGSLILTIKTKTRGRKRRSKTTSIGKAAFSVPPGKVTAVKLKLDAAAWAALKADHGRLNATMTVRKVSPEPVQIFAQKVQLVRTQPAKRRP
jgi:hypothetical protein